MGDRKKWIYRLSGVLLCFVFSQGLWSQTQGITGGERYNRLVIRNVMVIDGKGTPARGPMDINLKDNIIETVRGARQGDDAYEHEAHVLDATGLFLLPGLINLHAHIHDNRGGNPLPFE